MSTVRAQITLQGESGIAEDQFVNTIYFLDAAPYASFPFDAVTAAVSRFYNETVVGAGGTALAGFLSGFVAPAASIRFYDMLAAEPRVPTVKPFDLTLTNSNGDLPEEVAICASFHGAPPVTNRRRGRIYLGPFNVAALAGDTTTGGNLPSRPNGGTLAVIRGAMARLKGDFDAASTVWVIRSSRPATNYVDVVGGWVDDAWDTQRRRGVDPTSRLRWPSPA